MSEGLIVRRGGSGGKVFAFIVVTYPEGSTCTCSDGRKTLRAKGTTGSFVFNIPYDATWTISCTNGTLSKAETIVIDTEGQSENVTIVYQKYWIDYGEEISTSKKGTQILVDSSGLKLGDAASAGFSSSGGAMTTNKVNITNYSTLKCISSQLDTNNLWYLGVSDVDTNIDPPTAPNKTLVSGTSSTFSLDISNLTGEYYLFIARAYAPSPGINAIFPQIWLE